MVPLADSTIYEMEQRGEFPRRFALSPRCVVWDLADVEAWLASRRSSPIARAQHPGKRNWTLLRSSVVARRSQAGEHPTSEASTFSALGAWLRQEWR
jgi:prophage regulatory protein